MKALFFDIDGTLISFSTRHIPSSTLAALEQCHAKGIRLYIASGRPPGQLKLLCPEFHDIPFDGYILLNGQYCMNAKKELFFHRPIARKTLEVLVPYLKTVDYPVSVYELDYMYELRFNPGMYAYYKSLGKEDQMPPVEPAERMLEHDIYQICPYVSEDRDAEFLAHAPGMKSARWISSFADMIPSDGGKPEGIREVLRRENIDISECMAFGDGGNDITMLQACGIGVAMGNAEERVKAAADYVTSSVDEDGIARALSHFCVI